MAKVKPTGKTGKGGKPVPAKVGVTGPPLPPPSRPATLPPWLLAALLGGLALGLVLARLPFLSNPLVGEETHFAFMAVDNGHDRLDDKHNFLYLARIKGQMVYNAAEHPIPSYLFITKVLRRLSEGAGFDRLTFAEKTRTARLRFFACFCVGLLLLLTIAWHALRGADRLTALLVLSLAAFALSAPLMVGASVQPQMDGSIGLMWVGTAALCLFFASRPMSPAGRAALGAAAGFIACLGKNEWAMAMFGAGLIGLAAALALRRRDGTDPQAPSPRAERAFFLALLGGVVAGSLFSFALDPWNYLHGLDVMRRTQQASQANWGTTFLDRLRWIWPEFVLLAAAVAAAVAGLRPLLLHQFSLAALGLWSLALFAGFALSSWPGDGFPRYFCTSLFGLLCFLVALLPRLRLAGRLKAAGVALALAGTLWHGVQLAQIKKADQALGSLPGRSLEAHVARIERQRAEVAASPDQPVVTDLNFGYYYPAMDFIAEIVPKEQRADLLKR